MTTVAFDGKSLAADRLVGDNLEAGKIFKLDNGVYISGAGWYDHIIDFVGYLNALGREDENLPSLDVEGMTRDDKTEFILFNPEEMACYWFTWPNFTPVRYTETLIAIGSGGQYALGALHQGATAKEAIEIASRLDKHTGKGVDVITPRKKRTKRGIK